MTKIDNITSTMNYLDWEYVLIESNSTDGTKDLVEKYNSSRNIPCVKYFQPEPNGKGSAVKLGMELSDSDIIMIQDADLEYNPEEYPELLKPLLEEKCKFVLGSRHLGAGNWKIRNFDCSKWYAQLINIGSEVFSFIFALLYGVTLTDAQTMYKIFDKECIKGIKWRSNKFQLDWEIVCKLVKRGYIPMELPCTYNSRTSEEGKKINVLRDGFLGLWAIIYFRFFE